MCQGLIDSLYLRMIIPPPKNEEFFETWLYKHIRIYPTSLLELVNPSNILMSHSFWVEGKTNPPPPTKPNSSLVALPPNLRADCKALASTPWLRCKPSWAINCEAQWSPQRLRSNWPRVTYRKNGWGKKGSYEMTKKATVNSSQMELHIEILFQIRGPIISLPKSYLLGALLVVFSVAR